MKSCIESQSLVNGINNSIRPSQEVNLKCTNGQERPNTCLLKGCFPIKMKNTKEIL